MYGTPTATMDYNYWIMPVMVRKTINPQNVIAAACQAFNVTKEQLLSDCRNRLLSRVRSICYYILRAKTKLSLLFIGKFFNRDHTTVMHGIECVENDLSVTAYRQQMNEDLRRVMELI
jgi:chromosomal replication initiator protein